MKTVGILGGLGPEATIEYYRSIPALIEERAHGEPVPEMVIYSASLRRFIEQMERQNWAGVAAWLAVRVNALGSAGSDFVAIASNTPHIVFDEVESLSRVPLISIVEETCSRAESLGLRRVGLMGTKFTMGHDYYGKIFSKGGMEVLVPRQEEQQYIHEKLASEICEGIMERETKERLLSIVKRMLDESSIEGVILGCTELPLILDKDEFGIPFLNTTAIHVESIVHRCLEGRPD